MREVWTPPTQLAPWFGKAQEIMLQMKDAGEWPEHDYSEPTWLDSDVPPEFSTKPKCEGPDCEERVEWPGYEPSIVLCPRCLTNGNLPDYADQVWPLDSDVPWKEE